MPFRNQSAGIFSTLFFLLDELNAFVHRPRPEVDELNASSDLGEESVILYSVAGWKSHVL